MRLLFKERFFSWFDSYDVYSEGGEVVYEVNGKLSIGHRLEINDSAGHHVGTVQQEIFTFMPRFDIYINEQQIGTIKKEFTFFKPSFNVDCNGWSIKGDFFEWDYTILNASGVCVATVSKQFFNFTDTYVIDVVHEADALMALMVVLAIDAAKCSANN